MHRLLIKAVRFIGWLALMLISGLCELACWATGENDDDRNYNSLDDRAAGGGGSVDNQLDRESNQQGDRK